MIAWLAIIYTNNTNNNNNNNILLKNRQIKYGEKKNVYHVHTSRLAEPYCIREVCDGASQSIQIAQIYPNCPDTILPPIMG